MADSSLVLTPSAPHWLSRDRLTVYPRIFVAVYLVAAIVWVLLAVDLIDPKGKPLGYDFITFWAASWLSLAGEPAAAFDMGRIFAAEQIAVPENGAVFLWHYPPMFQLVVIPLALFPYLWSYGVAMATTLAAFLVVVRRLAPWREATWLALAFPGTFINLFHGQNGFVSAALFGGAIALLDRTPILAGALIGLLSYKPQLGLLIPLALLCARQWHAFAAAAATSLLFAAISTMVLGWETWVAFVHNIPSIGALLDSGMLPWAKIPSAYVALRLIGFGAPFAYMAHAVFALAIAATVLWIWWKRPPLLLAGAALVTGTVLVPPYLFDYDLVLLAIPITIVARDALTTGWLAGEREVLVLAWLTPLLAPAVTEHIGVPIAIISLLALFFVCARRALARAV